MPGNDCWHKRRRGHQSLGHQVDCIGQEHWLWITTNTSLLRKFSRSILNFRIPPKKNYKTELKIGTICFWQSPSFTKSSHWSSRISPFGLFCLEAASNSSWKRDLLGSLFFSILLLSVSRSRKMRRESEIFFFRHERWILLGGPPRLVGGPSWPRIRSASPLFSTWNTSGHELTARTVQGSFKRKTTKTFTFTFTGTHFVDELTARSTTRGKNQQMYI